MYCNFTVPIPVAPGKICRQKAKSGTYIHVITSRHYDPAKGYSVPDRTSIGKVDPDNPEQMYPNEQFFVHFPQTALPEAQPCSSRSSLLHAGSYVAIDRVARDYALPEMLEKHFADKAGLVLDLASYMIVEGKNQGQYYPDYAYEHPLFTKGMKVYGDSTVSAFLNSVTDDQINGFLNDWNARRDHRSRIYVSYDSTNKACQAGDIDFVEFGKAKVDVGLPIFNLAVAFDKTNKVPLFYERYPGSINDVSQFKCFVDKAYAYNYRHIGFILDRGYFSRANIEYMDEKKYQFIIMVKGCKPLVSSLIDEMRGNFELKTENQFQDQLLSGVTIKRKLYAEDAKERYFHLYFNAHKLAKELEEFKRKIETMRKVIHEHIGQEVSFAAPYTDYFEFYYDKDGKLLCEQDKSEAQTRARERCGYFCIVTSEAMSAEDAYHLYRGRDTSEKLFSADKSFIGSKSMRVHSAEAVTAKIFVEFIALIVRNRIYNLLKQQMLALPVKKNFLTVPAAIKELEKIEMIRINNGVYQLDHAISRNQEIILSAFGISKDEVKAKIAKIAAEIADSDSGGTGTDADTDVDEQPDDTTDDMDFFAEVDDAEDEIIGSD